MAALIRGKDWSVTPLGAMERWPQSLRTLVDMMIGHPLPMILLWGPDLIQIYNDGYRVIAGGKHPDALGQRTRDCWPEIWHVTKPLYDQVLAGESILLEDKLFLLNRGSAAEDIYLTVSYGPARDETGRIAGILATVTDTTRKVAAEIALRDSEDHYRHTVELNPQIPWTADASGAITDFSERLLNLTGLSRAEAMEDMATRLLHPDDRFRIVEAWRTAVETGESFDIIHRMRLANGSYRWMRSRAFPRRDENQRVLRWYGATEDIDDRLRLVIEREQLVAALENQRVRLAAIIAQAPAFICTLRGPTHIFELANDRYYEIVGPRDIIGKPLREAIPEVVAQGFLELLDHVYQTGETFVGNEMPAMLRRGPGTALERRYLNFVYQALREPDGSISGIFAHGVDVTDLVESREAIRASALRLRELADAMPQIVWTARPDGSLDYYNRRWFEYIEQPADAPEELLRWDRYIHPDDLAEVLKTWGDCVHAGQTYAIEFRIRRADGAYRWFLVRAVPHRDEHGAIHRWLGTCTDIDDRKELQVMNECLLASERAARTDAETASRAKDKFLATLSHELRTPLTPVVMTATAMEMDLGLSAEVREDAALIRRNVELETRLIDDLLDLSRVISGKLRLHVQPASLHQVIRNVLQIVGAQLHEKQLTVETDLAAANDTVEGDSARLQQMLWNLLKNAAKFTPEGGTVRIRTHNETRHEQDRIIVEVSDTGRGIMPELLARVFEPFEQGEAGVTQKYGGMGLGLAIVKAVVDLHGGTIHAHSPGANCGATFSVALPLAAAIPAPTGNIGVAPAAGLARPLRLLLVEDHPETARVLMRLLTLDGMDVRWAATIMEALQYAGAEPFDLILSDLGLPDGTGCDLLDQLRRENVAIPAIAMSGYGMDEDLQRSRDAGFAEHLVKPVTVPQLREAIQRVTNPAI